MALPLSTAKQLSSGKKSGKVVSEYGSKASSKKTKSFNGASTRFNSAKRNK